MLIAIEVSQKPRYLIERVREKKRPGKIPITHVPYPHSSAFPLTPFYHYRPTPPRWSSLTLKMYYPFSSDPTFPSPTGSSSLFSPSQSLCIHVRHHPPFILFIKAIPGNTCAALKTRQYRFFDIGPGPCISLCLPLCRFCLRAPISSVLAVLCSTFARPFPLFSPAVKTPGPPARTCVMCPADMFDIFTNP